MARFKRFVPKKHEGKITYKKGILHDIVYFAVLEVKNVELMYPDEKKRHSKSIFIKKEKDGITVDVVVKVDAIESVTDTAFKIQEAVRHNVEAVSDQHIYAVNVIINGVTFKGEKVAIN